MDQKSETEIIARILSGDREVYSLLVEEYKVPIYNLALRMTGDSDDANDLAQETFIRAFKNMRQFDLNKSFFTWLYTISLNIIRTHLRRKMDVYDRADSGFTVACDKKNPEQSLITDQQAMILNACLQKLPVDLREAIVLKYYQDLSFEEITIISGASLSAVKMRVYRGLERLKQLMAE